MNLNSKKSNMNTMIVNLDEDQALIQSDDKCDKYDYLISVACGAIGGMIDIFLVGAPGGDSVLEKWTDAQVDNAVKEFAKISGWTPKIEQADNVASAIGFLEKKFKVNYDQRHSVDVNNLFNMSTKNHHMMSLAHSPDIIGLFFSILNQFTSTASFAANGQLVTINTKTFELKGKNLVSKIFCGIANWFGHVMSDVAGSSGSRRNSGKGVGIVMPFYELFSFCKFGQFDVDKDRQDLAIIATRAFQEGYDFRFGLTTAIPVIVTDLLIRFIWALRRHFQYGAALRKCIPNQKHPDLRVMLIFGHCTLCIMDGMDAGVRSGGNFLVFFMRLNLIAWFRFVLLVLKEVCVRLKILSPLQEHLEAYRKINEALSFYLSELEEIDIEAFKRETEEYNNVVESFENAMTDEELNCMILELFDRMGYNKPWQGSFDEHMSNKNATLVFE